MGDYMTYSERRSLLNGTRPSHPFLTARIGPVDFETNLHRRRTVRSTRRHVMNVHPLYPGRLTGPGIIGHFVVAFRKNIVPSSF